MAHEFNLLASNPRSGLAVWFTEELLEKFLLPAVGGADKVYLTPIRKPERTAECVVFAFRVNADGDGRVLRHNSKSKHDFGASFNHAEGDMEKFTRQLKRGGEVKLFGVSPATATLIDTLLTVVVPEGTMTPPILKGERKTPAAKVKGGTAPKTDTDDVLVLVSIAGEELEFCLPMVEAFKTSLDWTQKGYRR